MSFRFVILRKRHLALLSAAVFAAILFASVNFPAAVSASTAARQLPIYCVERDQKVCAISFDAAWGDGRVRLPALKQRSHWARRIKIVLLALPLSVASMGQRFAKFMKNCATCSRVAVFCGTSSPS